MAGRAVEQRRSIIPTDFGDGSPRICNAHAWTLKIIPDALSTTEDCMETPSLKPREKEESEEEEGTLRVLKYSYMGYVWLL